MDNNGEKAHEFSKTVQCLLEAKDTLHILDSWNKPTSEKIETIESLKKTIATERKGLSQKQVKYASKLGLANYKIDVNKSLLAVSPKLRPGVDHYGPSCDKPYLARESSKLKKQRRALLDLLQQEADKSDGD